MITRWAVLSEKGRYILSCDSEEQAKALCADMEPEKQFTYVRLQTAEGEPLNAP